MMGFEEWNSTMRSHCGHYYGEPDKTRPDSGGAFNMHIRHGVDVAEIHCAIDRIHRTRDGIRRDDAEHLFLLVQKVGKTRVTHAGHQELLQAGECILIDSTSPAELGYGGQKASFISAHLPRSLCLDGRRRGVATGRKISSSHAIARDLRTLVMPGDAQAATVQGPDLLNDLVAMAFGQIGITQDAMMIHDRRHRFGFVTSVIDRNLTDAELTLDRLAQAVNMSRRQLQREFRDHGTSFTSYLNCQRLKHVAERLRQAARLGQTPQIAQLAYGAGLGDLSHFNRSFRERYGKTPRDFLRQTERRLRER